MSKRKVKKYDSTFKVKVVLEALREEITLNELCAKHELVPVTVREWKKEFLANAELAFDKDKAIRKYKMELKARDSKEDELHRQLGQLNAQLEWAKKKAKELGLE